MRADENVLLITPTKVPKIQVKFEDICVIDMKEPCSTPRKAASPPASGPSIPASCSAGPT